MGIFGNLGTDGYCGVISEFWVVRLDGVINHYSTEMTSSFSHQKNASVASNKHVGLQVLHHPFLKTKQFFPDYSNKLMSFLYNNLISTKLRVSLSF